MEQGKFENSIRKKFEGKTQAAPAGTWSNIENALNAELVTAYASKNLVYKWVSVAAIFLVAILFGALYYPFNKTNQNQTDLSYNALLSNDVNYDNYLRPNFSGIGNTNFSFAPLTDEDQKVEKAQPIDESRFKVYLVESRNLESKKPEIILATVSSDIYRYRSSGSIPRKISDDNTQNRVWAGVEAGAGNFNADFGGSGALANSFNAAGLATAVGSSGFVNPTTRIAQDMDEAIATTIGMDFGIQMGEKWTLESGLAYTSVENSGTAVINVLDVYTIDNNTFINDGSVIDEPSVGSNSSREATVEVRENYDYDVELRNRVQFASIPLKAGYFLFRDKFSLRVNAGVSANYLVEGNISDPSQQILNSDQLDIFNEWSFDGIGGLEFGYSIFDKFDVTVEPNYRHSITPMSNSANSPSRFLVQTGLRYTLK